MIATVPTNHLDFLSRSLSVNINIIIGRNAIIDNIVHKLFRSQNFVLFFSDAGSIWFAFFHKNEPIITNIRSSTIHIIKNRVISNPLNQLMTSVSFNIPITSKAIAITQQIIAHTLLQVALLWGSHVCSIFIILPWLSFP